MYFIEILGRLPVTENEISLVAALVITGLFGLLYRKLADAQRREEMLQDFLNK